MDTSDKIQAEIDKIKSLSSEMKAVLRELDKPHSLYGALLIELELIQMNLEEIKKALPL